MAQPHCVVRVDIILPAGSDEVNDYIIEQQKTAVAAAEAEAAQMGMETETSGYLEYWTREADSGRTIGGKPSRLAYLGMCVSAKPVSNGNVESALSVAKRISADDRQSR